jgi:hypothetical protein
MSAHQHDKNCLEVNHKATAIRNGWIKKYPNYCRECDGTGWSKDWDELQCGYCIAGDKPICPRCREDLFPIILPLGHSSCDSCGFDEANPEGLPGEPDCICEETDYYSEWECDR